ncbi:hypothetical protein BDF19DRAFT_421562 [Syncephalis fuscata]|nr:hypothetical protein BDF19DRAFT_421562 [Syncephalis fuscata]
MASHTLKDPCELLDSMVETFQPDADLAILNDITRQRQATETIRAHEQDNVHGQLKSLSRELELAKAKAIRPAVAPSEEEHANQMVKLDRQKFLLAKEIQDYEKEGRYPL